MKNQITLKSITKEIDIERGSIIGVGVSGGVDSMVLLHAILEIRKVKDFSLIAVHVNHQLRDKESERDQAFVEDFCNRNNIEFYCEKVDVKSNKNINKLTEEESARILRYQVFNKVIENRNINRFYLAHHANDQAETILMHIFRGSGTLGATGMGNNLKFLRPMINFSRQEILSIADKNKIAYVTDSTNLKNVCNRNTIRNKILPEIEKLYPGVVDAVCRFGRNLSDDQDFIESCIPLDMIEFNNDNVKIKIEALALHKAICVRIIKHVCSYLGVHADILSSHIYSIIGLAKLQNGSLLDLPHGLTAAKEYDFVTIYKNIEKESKKDKSKLEDFGIKMVEVEINQVCFGDGNLYISADNLENAVWRTWQKNDYFCKLGSRGSKKLVDYFTDKKIPLLKRKNIPLLAKGNEILVVAGQDISEKVKINLTTSKIVRITYLTKL